MPAILRSAEKQGDARIVNLGSVGHGMPPSGGLILEDATSDMTRHPSLRFPNFMKSRVWGQMFELIYLKYLYRQSITILSE